MAEALTLKTNEEPTIFNKEMAIGTFIEPGLGTIVGGIIGKKRMEREQTHGRQIDTPSYLNKDALLGCMVGGVIGAIAGLGILSVPFGLIGASIGVVIGGARGKHTQEKEYAQAVEQQREQQMGISPLASKRTAQEYENVPTKSYRAEIQAERARSAIQQKQL